MSRWSVHRQFKATLACLATVCWVALPAAAVELPASGAATLMLPDAGVTPSPVAAELLPVFTLAGPAPQATGETVTPEQGGASWYARHFQGRRTASGERYDQNELTAAHKTLPFGTVVRVRSEVTGQEIDVRINDRGPFVAGRIIDLSHAAARALGMLQMGVKKVTLLLPPGLRPGSGSGKEARAAAAAVARDAP